MRFLCRFRFICILGKNAIRLPTYIIVQLASSTLLALIFDLLFVSLFVPYESNLNLKNHVHVFS